MAGLDTAAPADVEALRQQYGGLAGQAAQQVLQPTAEREAEVFERIRASQRPEEERQRLALEQRLAAQGRLGTRTAQFGGTPESLALAKAQEEAQDRASLAAMQQAQAERRQALGEAQTFGGMFTQQAGLSSQLQSQAQQRAQQLASLGLSADRVQAQLESEGFGRQLQLGQAGIQAAQAQSALRSQAQQRANQLANLGLSAEQVQSRMEAEGFGRQMQLAGAGLQAQQAQSALESQAQQRATQLAQLGLSAEQIQSRLQTEGLGRATTAAGQAAQLAQLAGGLQAQQAGLGAQFAGLRCKPSRTTAGSGRCTTATGTTGVDCRSRFVKRWSRTTAVATTARHRCAWRCLLATGTSPERTTSRTAYFRTSPTWSAARRWFVRTSANEWTTGTSVIGTRPKRFVRSVRHWSFGRRLSSFPKQPVV